MNLYIIRFELQPHSYMGVHLVCYKISIGFQIHISMEVKTYVLLDVNSNPAIQFYGSKIVLLYID